uniref:Nonstructural protein n=1 Tax=Bird deltacoronavirus PluvialisCN24 TaxID=3237955 RepID=A0AB39AFT4_9NIDO
MQSRTTKLTYPLAPTHEVLIPHTCSASIEPCSIPDKGCYGFYIQEAFTLILEEIVSTGNTKSPHAVLVQNDLDCKIWKLHWQRGKDCGPGHCITVFQNRPPGSVNWRVDFLTHNVYAIPLANVEI